MMLVIAFVLSRRCLSATSAMLTLLSLLLFLGELKKRLSISGVTFSHSVAFPSRLSTGLKDLRTRRDVVRRRLAVDLLGFMDRDSLSDPLGVAERLSSLLSGLSSTPSSR